MNTILTADEAYELGQAHHLPSVKVRAIEAAVLAKLREQEPVAWTPVTTKLPAWSEDQRVLCFCEGYDYGGTQFITLKASDFYEYDQDNPDEPGTAESKTVSHWIDENTAIRLAKGAAPLPAVARWREFLCELIAACENGDIHEDCEQPDWRAIYVTAKAMLAAAPEAPAQAEQAAEPVRHERAAFEAWWDGCRLTIQEDFWRGWQARAALASTERQPSVPPQWREVVKVMREALDWCVAEINRDSPAVKNARPAIALADSLEGGE